MTPVTRGRRTRYTVAPMKGDQASPRDLGPGDGELSPAPAPPLIEYLPDANPEADVVLDRFLAWCADAGFELYPAQEEALLEIMAGRHVILNTPTGSGKSLVALGLHFRALANGERSVYTSPIKALASEKFFALCELFGPDRVGMLTGDASLNPGAPIVCATAEVLSNMALRQGERLDAPWVVMDEFHYYGDPDRGVAWQIPLITLPRTRFLLMSATLGDTSRIEQHLKRRTVHEAAVVQSAERPVPLDWEYRETPLHETVYDLVTAGKAPIYLVNFTQRECAEQAQKLTSMQLTSREDRQAIKAAIAGFRFDTPYGKEMRRFLSFGIGVHHAGLLPKYRLLVEQLAQRGLLKVISGTDTLGVGVNIPIRTVLFTRLAKYDGHKVRILRVRDFQQIAGRAGRKGFDDRGSVVAQAPDHVIEQRTAEKKATQGARKKKGSRKQPAKGEISWSRETFENLIAKPPETLKSRFKVTQGMIVQLLQRDAEENDPSRRNLDSLRRLIAASHEDDASKARLLGQSAQMLRSLHRAGIVEMSRDTRSDYLWMVVNERLQYDFSLFHALSLYLVESLALLDTSDPDYALDVVTQVEAILEDPTIVLRRQRDRMKQELLEQLKADGVSYEERVKRLDEVTWPQPRLEFIEATFDDFRRGHPWIRAEAIRPKSVGREMLETYSSFADYVHLYGLQRFEGVLLRYINQLYKTLVQSVPMWARTQALYDAMGFFRTMIETIDTSLLEEWESLLHPEVRLQHGGDAHAAYRDLAIRELLDDPKVLGARIRAELHRMLHALSRGDWEAAARAVRHVPDEPEGPWTSQRIERSLAPFVERYGFPRFDHEARLSEATTIRREGELRWSVAQTLYAAGGATLWAVEGMADLGVEDALDQPLIRLSRIGE